MSLSGTFENGIFRIFEQSKSLDRRRICRGMDCRRIKKEKLYEYMWILGMEAKVESPDMSIIDQKLKPYDTSRWSARKKEFFYKLIIEYGTTTREILCAILLDFFQKHNLIR